MLVNILYYNNNIVATWDLTYDMITHMYNSEADITISTKNPILNLNKNYIDINSIKLSWQSGSGYF